MTKDLFSRQSAAYVKYRPSYPPALFDYILSFTKGRDCAWDCATGNGQAALALAASFKKVEASDISASQLQNAKKKENIEYHLCPAEHTPFAGDGFDLITVATAYHWLHHKKFRDEAMRVGKNGAVVAAWAYDLFSCEDEGINRIIDALYYETLADCWDRERKLVEERYATVAFDFDPLPARDFDIVLDMDREQFTGYLQTWSAVQTYLQKNQSSPLALIEPALNSCWMEGSKRFHFPLFLRMGRIEK